MTFEMWLELYGDDTQQEARVSEYQDCCMDDYIEQEFFKFLNNQHGDLSYEDCVKYGNLDVHLS